MSRKNLKNKHLETKVIHAGNEPDKETGAVIPPIFQTSTFVQSSPGKHSGYEYTRSHNPTRTRLEECLAASENAKYALVTSSGLSATSLIMHALAKNSLILCGDDVYGGTYRIFTTVFQDRHRFEFIDTTDPKAVAKVLREKKPDLLWMETPTNPLLKMSDIKAITKVTKELKIKTVVDNTFMSPAFQNPLSLGADMVLHSLTKYINGHSDVVGGAVMTNSKSFHQKLWTLQNSIGPSQSPFDSWLVLRGIKTLGLRMKAHQENAMAVAKALETSSKVSQVIYPGLKTHPQHKLAKSQMSGFGGMVTVILKGGLKETNKFLKKLKLFSLAESLGGVESLVNHPAIMTHASIPKKIREELGITDSLIRLSVGIENKDDLVEDVLQALG